MKFELEFKWDENPDNDNGVIPGWVHHRGGDYAWLCRDEANEILGMNIRDSRTYLVTIRDQWFPDAVEIYKHEESDDWHHAHVNGEEVSFVFWEGTMSVMKDMVIPDRFWVKAEAV